MTAALKTLYPAKTPAGPLADLVVPSTPANLTELRDKLTDLERSRKQLEQDSKSANDSMVRLVGDLDCIRREETSLMRKVTMTDADSDEGRAGRQELSLLASKQAIFNEKLDSADRQRGVRDDLLDETAADIKTTRQQLDAAKKGFYNAVFIANEQRLVKAASEAELLLLALSFLAPNHRRRDLRPGNSWWDDNKGVHLATIDTLGAKIKLKVEEALR